MTKRRIGPIVRGAIGVASAALGLIDALMGGSLILIAGGALGVAGATDTAFQGTRRSEILTGPLTYAALAQ
jgi:hypothetical protein